MTSRWIRLPVDNLRRTAPRLPGVYALFAEGQLMYVGCAVNLCERLGTHGTIREIRRYIEAKDVHVAYSLSRRAFEERTREARLIAFNRPSLNVECSGRWPRPRPAKKASGLFKRQRLPLK